MKLKILPSTLREKKRYVKIKVISEEPITFSDLKSAIINTLLDFYGEFYFSELSLRILEETFKENEQTCILRCNHKAVQKLIAGLGVVQRLGDTRIIVKIVKVSGTIKKLRV